MFKFDQVSLKEENGSVRIDGTALKGVKKTISDSIIIYLHREDEVCGTMVEFYEAFKPFGLLLRAKYEDRPNDPGHYVFVIQDQMSFLFRSSTLRFTGKSTRDTKSFCLHGPQKEEEEVQKFMADLSREFNNTNVDSLKILSHIPEEEPSLDFDINRLLNEIPSVHMSWFNDILNVPKMKAPFILVYPVLKNDELSVQLARECADFSHRVANGISSPETFCPMYLESNRDFVLMISIYPPIVNSLHDIFHDGVTDDCDLHSYKKLNVLIHRSIPNESRKTLLEACSILK